MPKFTPLTPEIIDEVFKSLAEGETLRNLAKKHGFNRGWFHHVVTKDKDLSSLYARAREAQCEAWADEIIAEADAADDRKNVNSARLRIDAKKWIMARLHPRVFGDRVEQVSSGQVDHVIRWRTLEEERAARSAGAIEVSPSAGQVTQGSPPLPLRSGAREEGDGGGGGSCGGVQ